MFGRLPLSFAAPLLASLVAFGCTRVEEQRSSSGASADPAGKPLAVPSATARGPLVLAQGLRMVKGTGEGDLAANVKAERETAAADGRDLVVYVGATWCEPCQHFHHAAERGELDGEFPTLTILEFDLDRDRERLIAAGYSSHMIPLFVMPTADGRGSERRFSGSVKGNAAVSNIAPRLRSLLAK